MSVHLSVFTAQWFRGVNSLLDSILASRYLPLGHPLNHLFLVAFLSKDSRQQHEQPCYGRCQKDHPNSDWLIQYLSDVQRDVTHITLRLLVFIGDSSSHYKKPQSCMEGA